MFRFRLAFSHHIFFVGFRSRDLAACWLEVRIEAGWSQPDVSGLGMFEGCQLRLGLQGLVWSGVEVAFCRVWEPTLLFAAQTELPVILFRFSFRV